jgi:hypothetical protein
VTGRTTICDRAASLAARILDINLSTLYRWLKARDL